MLPPLLEGGAQGIATGLAERQPLVHLGHLWTRHMPILSTKEVVRHDTVCPEGEARADCCGSSLVPNQLSLRLCALPLVVHRAVENHQAGGWRVSGLDPEVIPQLALLLTTQLLLG